MTIGDVKEELNLALSIKILAMTILIERLLVPGTAINAFSKPQLEQIVLGHSQYRFDCQLLKLVSICMHFTYISSCKI